MEQRDTILQLIQKMALSLRAIFNILPPEEFESIDQFTTFGNKFEKATEINLEQISSFKHREDLATYLNSNLALSVENQESLADLLVQIGEKTILLDKEKANTYYMCALQIYLLLDETTQTFDWTRQQKTTALKNKLKS